MHTPTVPTPSASQSRTGYTAHGADAPPAAQPVPTLTLRALAPAAAGASDAVWVPAVSAILVLAVGAMSLATDRPWLFAALGPSALLVASSPGHATTRFHAIVLGHLTGLACAWIALLLMGAGDAPTLLAGNGVAVARVWASAAAVALMAVVQPSLRAYHPPAAATALLVTLGVHRLTGRNALAMLGGVLVLALLGEWFQRMRLRERPKGNA